MKAMNTILLPSLAILRLTGNRIAGIDRGLGAAMPALRFVYLNSNEMNTVVPGTLQQFKRLEIADFSYNNIAELPGATFKGLDRLMQLNLDGMYGSILR